MNDCITIISGIIDWIVRRDRKRNQAFAECKRSFADLADARRYRHRCQAKTAVKRMGSDLCHRTGKCNSGKIPARVEGPISDGRYRSIKSHDSLSVFINVRKQGYTKIKRGKFLSIFRRYRNKYI